MKIASQAKPFTTGGSNGYPEPEIRIDPSTLPISPGDVVELIAAPAKMQEIPPFSPYPTLSIYNSTTRQSAQLARNPPSGTALVGNSIEWIVERPRINDQLTNLMPFFLNGWKGIFGAFKPNATPEVFYRPSSPATGTAYIVTIRIVAIGSSTPALYPVSNEDTDGSVQSNFRASLRD